MIDRDWRVLGGGISGGGRSGGGRCGGRCDASWDSIHLLTRNCGIVENWVQQGLPRDERVAGSGKTVDLEMMQYLVYAVLSVWSTRCMQYSVYAVLGVNSRSWHPEIERDDLTLCSQVMVELRMRTRQEMSSEIMRRNWDLREFLVRVNLLFPKQQVQLPIQPVITLIRGLLNPIWRVIPLIVHIHLNPLYCSHVHPPSLFLVHNSTIIAEHKVKSSPAISMLRSLVITKYSVHRAQHTPSTASTQVCLSSLHSCNYDWTPECSSCFRRASLQDQPPPASSPWEPKGMVTSSHSHGYESTNWRIESH